MGADQTHKLGVGPGKLRLDSPTGLTEEATQEHGAQEMRLPWRGGDEHALARDRDAQAAGLASFKASRQILKFRKRYRHSKAVTAVFAPPIANQMRRWLQERTTNLPSLVPRGSPVEDQGFQSCIVAGQRQFGKP
jgi:hypothetical protein